MPRSYEEMKRRIEWNVAKIDKRVGNARNIIMDQLEIGFMTPELLELFVNLLNSTISLTDDRRKLVEYAETLGMDIQ